MAKEISNNQREEVVMCGVIHKIGTRVLRKRKQLAPTRKLRVTKDISNNQREPFVMLWLAVLRSPADAYCCTARSAALFR